MPLGKLCVEFFDLVMNALVNLLILAYLDLWRSLLFAGLRDSFCEFTGQLFDSFRLVKLL